ncbi:hypothetical protein B0F90DRAFT_1816812 [Multifurca ochricompacta]|uniref:Uncharacterized protein n=1 Tax=Multifurca ochricompacta TaxID=376703 RepID=A0AAD4QP80_9AGAM|nr:hypothetical protein B0F90DRAFT_1816812 [Multifurca ochricompacta]
MSSISDLYSNSDNNGDDPASMVDYSHILDSLEPRSPHNVFHNLDGVDSNRLGDILAPMSAHPGLTITAVAVIALTLGLLHLRRLRRTKTKATSMMSDSWDRSPESFSLKSTSQDDAV